MGTLAVAEPITVQRVKAKRENTWMPLIASCNDGQTRRYTLTDGEKVSSVVNDLRNAARSIERSVTIVFDDGKDAKTATSFRFLLRDKITRTRKDTTSATPVASEAKPVAKKQAK